METKLEYLTAGELSRAAASAPAVILPLASVEKLGAHGPIGLDLLVAQKVAPLIAARCGCLAAPVVPYGDTTEFCGMEGTIHVPPQVLEEYCYAVALSLLQSCGARAIIFLNVHSLNGEAASAVCRRLRRAGYAAATADWWAAVRASGRDLLDDPEGGCGHGGELITSVAMAVAPKAVHPERADNERPLPDLAAVNRWQGTPFSAFGNFPMYCRNGSWGDVRTASEEKGEALLERGVASVAAFICAAFPSGADGKD